MSQRSQLQQEGPYMAALRSEKDSYLTAGRGGGGSLASARHHEDDDPYCGRCGSPKKDISLLPASSSLQRGDVTAHTTSVVHQRPSHLTTEWYQGKEGPVVVSKPDVSPPRRHETSGRQGGHYDVAPTAALGGPTTTIVEHHHHYGGVVSMAGAQRPSAGTGPGPSHATQLLSPNQSLAFNTSIYDAPPFNSRRDEVDRVVYGGGSGRDGGAAAGTGGHSVAFSSSSFYAPVATQSRVLSPPRAHDRAGHHEHQFDQPEDRREVFLSMSRAPLRQPGGAHQRVLSSSYERLDGGGVASSAFNHAAHSHTTSSQLPADTVPIRYLKTPSKDDRDGGHNRDRY
jgi:hypothetical protein